MLIGQLSGLPLPADDQQMPLMYLYDTYHLLNKRTRQCGAGRLNQ